MDLARKFAPVASALRDDIIEHYRDRGERLDTPAGLRTLDTNSTLALERAELMMRILAARGGPEDLSGLKVVDLGCGFGSLSLVFATAGASVVGVDPNSDRSAVAAAVAQRMQLDARFTRGWLDDLTLDDEQFDVAILNNVLCYLVDRGDRRRALGHALRVLVPGGHLALRDPSRLAPTDPFTGLPLVHQLPPRLARAATKRRSAPRSDVRLRTTSSARLELRRAGFRKVRSHHVDGPRWRPERYYHLTGQRPPA